MLIDEYAAFEELDSEKTCPFCGEDFAEDSEVAIISPCGHVVHKECLKRYFAVRDRSPAAANLGDQCPVCKGPTRDLDVAFDSGMNIRQNLTIPLLTLLRQRLMDFVTENVRDDMKAAGLERLWKMWYDGYNARKNYEKRDLPAVYHRLVSQYMTHLGLRKDRKSEYAELAAAYRHVYLFIAPIASVTNEDMEDSYRRWGRAMSINAGSPKLRWRMN